MAVQLKIGEKYHHFRINGKAYQAGSMDYEISGGKLRIWPKDRSKNSPVVPPTPIESVVDGDNGDAAFANAAAIETWIGQNFFF